MEPVVYPQPRLPLTPFDWKIKVVLPCLSLPRGKKEQSVFFPLLGKGKRKRPERKHELVFHIYFVLLVWETSHILFLSWVSTEDITISKTEKSSCVKKFLHV